MPTRVLKNSGGERAFRATLDPERKVDARSLLFIEARREGFGLLMFSGMRLVKGIVVTVVVRFRFHCATFFLFVECCI